jgi:hypothetical protein
MNDTRIANLLDELTPSYDDRRGDWERVAAYRAETPPARRRPSLPEQKLARTLEAIAAGFEHA